MDVAVTEQPNVPVTAVAAVTLMFSGEGVHVTPAGKLAAVGVTATVPVNPPAGVTVIVEFWLAPVAEINVSGVEATVKLP